MRIKALACLLFVSFSVACHSFEDYLYPDASVAAAATTFVLPEAGVRLPYVTDFAPLPVVKAQLNGHSIHALMSTRRSKHSIAPHAVPSAAVAAGQARVPRWDGKVVATVLRDVVRIEHLELGAAKFDDLLFLVEPLPIGVSVMLSPGVLTDGVVTLDGPAKELRFDAGELERVKKRWGSTISGNAVPLDLELLSGAGAYSSKRFMASITSVIASELDGGLLVGRSSSTVVEIHRGPELLQPGVGGLDSAVQGAREVRMDNVFGRDFKRAKAQIVHGLGSGWFVIGARALESCVVQIDPANRLVRLEGGGW